MRIFHNPNYNFIRWRWHALIASVVVIWAGVLTMYLHGGIPMGIDFSGGSAVTLQFTQPTTEDAVRHALDGLPGNKGDVVVQRYGQPGQNQMLIRLPMMTGAEQGTNLEQSADQALALLQKAGLQFVTPPLHTDFVGPVMGHDLQQKGILATLTALAGITVYVALRFRFVFAIGALVATFHDILITLVFLGWFHYELSLIVIAALLTITGYSVNDTIVVFDRVRENQRNQRREPLDQLVNASVNQTLGRTVITSGVTFLAVLALYLFGGEVLRGFAFTMLVGVITGTYSTPFIAASIAIILSRRRPAAAPASAAVATGGPRRPVAKAAVRSGKR
jgi:preprotein translocase subunit SecF